MKVKCFGCDVLIEADNTDAVTDAFVAHGQQSHTWSYPEEAIRNYARNCAEATERLTGGTERLPEIGGITIHPVTRDRIDDWLKFFDHDAFAGNPDWASCYCLEPHRPVSPEQPERPWRETRATVADRLRGGTTSVSRVRRWPTYRMGQCLAALRLRPLQACRSRGTRAGIRDRRLVFRHRPTVPAARDRLGTAGSRHRGRLCPRCSVDRRVSSQQTRRERRRAFPRAAVHVRRTRIPADQGAGP